MSADAEMIVLAVVGSKKSGKTTTIEVLTKSLKEKGYRVCVVKHVPEPNFTIDKEGKDTWRYAQSGADRIISISEDEIATIEKTYVENVSLEDIHKRCEGSDIVFLEGFRKLASTEPRIYKIVIVKFEEEISKALETFSPVLAFVTLNHSTRLAMKGTTFIDLRKDPQKLADLVEMLVEKRVAT